MTTNAFAIFYEKKPQIKSMLTSVLEAKQKNPQHSTNIVLSKQSSSTISMIEFPFFLTFMVLKWDVKRITVSLTIQNTQNCTEHNTIIKILVLKRQNSIWERKSSKSKIGKNTEEEVTSCTCKKQNRKEFITNGRDGRTVADKIRDIILWIVVVQKDAQVWISHEKKRVGRQDR